jgi:hypothetical protein
MTLHGQFSRFWCELSVSLYHKTMRVYLDMCCLKRPFDDQAQPRIRLESEAVLALLSVPTERVEFLHGAAQDLENDQNPVAHRAAKVGRWLQDLPLMDLPDASLQPRTAELMSLGYKNFDAFHVACAELGGAAVFCTCDDACWPRRRAMPKP